MFCTLRTSILAVAVLIVTAGFFAGCPTNYTLTYAAGADGTISGVASQTVSAGGSGTPVSAVANTGYHFTGWSDGLTRNPRTDADVTASISVMANFAINQYTLTYTAGLGGTISGASPQTVDYEGSGTAVTAVGNTSYVFSQWSDGSTQNPRSDASVTANIGVTAQFTVITYTLTYTAGPHGSLQGALSQAIAYGQSGTPVTAMPDADYIFTQWSDGSTQNPRTDTNVTADVNATASFQKSSAPVVTSFKINNGDTTAEDAADQLTTSVALNNTATSDPTDYMATAALDGAGQPDFSQATWAAYDVAPAFAVASGVGAKTIYFKVRNAAGLESDAVSATIFLTPRMASVKSGTFTMGNSGMGDDATVLAENSGYGWETPTHQVTLSAYEIGKYDVTTAEYCSVLNWALANGYLKDSSGGPWHGSGDVYAGGNVQKILAITDSGGQPGVHWCNIQYADGVFAPRTRPGLPTGTDYPMATHPAQDLSWYGAAAFCNWLSEWQGLTPCYDVSLENWPLVVAPPVSGGYRLPTEAEWERAAAWDVSAPGGPKHWIYADMSDAVMSRNRCNCGYSDETGSGFANPLGLEDWNMTSPVGWFNGTNVSPNGNIQTVDSPSPVGCYDMTGFVTQWVQDWQGFYGAAAQRNPTGPAGPLEQYRILRGIGELSGYYYIDIRTAARGHSGPANTSSGTGFRVARSYIDNGLTLAYLAGPNGKITGPTPQTVPYGGSGRPVTAVADGGYHFLQWSDNSTQNPRADTSVTADISVTATFVVDVCTLTYTAGPNGSITGVSPQTLLYGGSGSAVTAVADSGYHFAQWTDGSTLNPRTDTNVTGDINVTATFAQSCPLTIEMSWVSAGTFTMGNSQAEDDATYVAANELPAHQVMLSRYQIGKYDVTNGQYCAVLNWALNQGYLKDAKGAAWENSGDVYAGRNLQLILKLTDTYCSIEFTGTFIPKTQQAGMPQGMVYSLDSHPVIDVSWYGAVAFCNWLSEWEGLTPCYDVTSANWPLVVAPPTAGGYRLPTEAEWERAAAWDGGTHHWNYGFMSDVNWGPNGNRWCNDYWNDGTKDVDFVNPLGLALAPYTSPVGWFNGKNVSPNGGVATLDGPSTVGAYDMSGNVFQWVQDWYDGTFYNTTMATLPNPMGPADSTTYKVVRGGAFNSEFYDTRTAARASNLPSSTERWYGFRIARTP